jgi:hypothetical protein
MANLGIIKDIQENKLEPDQLVNCLDITQNFVLSNAIKQIVKLKLDRTDVIEKLERLSTLMGKENQLVGIYTVGHLAIAALNKLNTKKSLEKYKELTDTLNEWNKECVDKLINSDAFNE